MKTERKAALTLLVLAPTFGEVISGSTPLLALPLVFPIVYNVALYGCGALAIREIARRRSLSFANIWVLGLAYGVLEEGLVVTSWFNPYWPDAASMRGYGVFLGMNWVWAVALTVYHATFSITIPIFVAETWNSSVAKKPWLSLKGLRRDVIVLVLAAVIGLFLFGFLEFRKQGYHPPAAYLIALGMCIGLAVFGLHWRVPGVTRDGRLRPLAALLGLSVVTTIVFFVLGWGGQSLLPRAPMLTVLLMVTVAWLAFRSVRRLSKAPGFTRRHQVALISGPTLFFSLLQLLRPFPQPLVALLGAWVLWRLVRARPSDELLETAQ